jgi:hypothetical protein
MRAAVCPPPRLRRSQCTFALPAAAGTGTWTLVEVDVVDRTGNVRTAPNGELQALGYPTTLGVTP